MCVRYIFDQLLNHIKMNFNYQLHHSTFSCLLTLSSPSLYHLQFCFVVIEITLWSPANTISKSVPDYSQTYTQWEFINDHLHINQNSHWWKQDYHHFTIILQYQINLDCNFYVTRKLFKSHSFQKNASKPSVMVEMVRSIGLSAHFLKVQNR